VEVLRNDLGSDSERVSAIQFDGTSMGDCNPDGGDYDCTMYDCASTLSSMYYTATASTIAVELTFTGHSHDCDCDTTSWECSKENTVSGRTAMTAVARVTLTPLETGFSAGDTSLRHPISFGMPLYAATSDILLLYAMTSDILVHAPLRCEI